ncbi:MAG: hypothetical protein Q8O57_06220, partial [Kiritimatiellota bacterium]|nr:hypothetical protein [Kiritimatiellota bacterium]
VGNWERELRTLFRLHFRILGSAHFALSRESDNPFLDPRNSLAIVSVDTLWREPARACLSAAPPFDLVIFDEAARVDDALYYSVRPMLAVSGGRLVAMSTPFGKRGWWHKEWIEGGDPWERIEIKATECPRITPAFLAEERASLGDWWFQQEYDCQFVETVDQVFSYDVVMAAISAEIQPLWEVANNG